MANILSIGEMTETSEDKYITFNDAIKFITTLMTGARDIVSSLPTGIENACWIVGTAFSTYSQHQIIFYLGGAFYAMTPVEGMALWVWDENAWYDFNGSSWVKRSLTTVPAGNWKVFYSNGSGAMTELALAATGQALIAQGASAAPVFGNITSIIAAGNWKLFYSNGSAAMIELALGGEGTVLRSAGASAAPTFATAETRLASATVNLQNGDAKTNIYTVPTGKKLIVTRVVIRNPSGDMTGGTDFDLGDGADADTWKNGIDLSALGTSQYRVITGDDNNYTIFDAADVFGIKPATGATADVTATAELFGYLYDA